MIKLKYFYITFIFLILSNQFVIAATTQKVHMNITVNPIEKINIDSENIKIQENSVIQKIKNKFKFVQIFPINLFKKILNLI